MAADHGRAGSYPPGFGHAGSLRAHRRPRYQPAAFVGELLAFFGRMYQQAQGFSAPPVHDPRAVAYVIVER
ncbi:hypothetical protein M8494_28670 [Serratia ureilytica]